MAKTLIFEKICQKWNKFIRKDHRRKDPGEKLAKNMCNSQEMENK